MKQILITNVQRFSLHDGPGIRTTVFLKGCPLRCPWCSNPENLETMPEDYERDGECGTYGEYISCDELYEEVMRDAPFYEEEHGGVTFSGGEALLQIRELEPLLKRLAAEQVHMAVETCLFVSPEQLELALRYINLFYVDVKLLNTGICKSIIGGNLDIYLKNLDWLFSFRDKKNRPKNIILRVPFIGGHTDSKENADAVLGLIERYRPIKVELIKGHNLGASKYESLGKPVPDFAEANEDLMKECLQKIQRLGIETEICKI